MTKIAVASTIEAPLTKVWDYWTKPEHITKWAFASDDWAAPEAENDVRVRGKFRTLMAAKDGSRSFDFDGVYTAVAEPNLIEYDMSDGRHVKISFVETKDGVEVTETFDAETENSEELQRNGWQAILDNFKSYVENN